MTGSILLISGSAESRALNEAIASLRTAPGGLEQLVPQIDLLTARCLAYPAETRQLWDWFEKQQPCGAVEDLAEPFEGQLRLLDERIQLVKGVQTLAAEIGRRNGLSSHEAPLAEALNDLAAQRDRIAEMWERMNAPVAPWPGPHETREERRAAFERGEYEDIETILARVRAGGPVSKDDLA